MSEVTLSQWHEPDARTSPPRLLWTVTEAAGQLRISRAQMFRLIAAGDVTTVKIGRLTRIRSEALHAFLRRLENRP